MPEAHPGTCVERPRPRLRLQTTTVPLPSGQHRDRQGRSQAGVRCPRGRQQAPRVSFEDRVRVLDHTQGLRGPRRSHPVDAYDQYVEDQDRWEQRRFTAADWPMSFQSGTLSPITLLEYSQLPNTQGKLVASCPKAMLAGPANRRQTGGTASTSAAQPGRQDLACKIPGSTLHVVSLVGAGTVKAAACDLRTSLARPTATARYDHPRPHGRGLQRTMIQGSGALAAQLTLTPATPTAAQDPPRTDMRLVTQQAHL